jgi:hypothetical protein
MGKIKWNSIDVDIYETKVYFGFISTDDEFKKALNKYSDGLQHEESYAIFFYDNDDEKRIIFKKQYFHPKLIAHECFHVTHHIMDEIGEEFSINSHESFAWLNEYLFNSIYKHYEKIKKNNL